MNRLASAPLSGDVELAPEELGGAASMTPLEVDVLSSRGGPSRIRKTRSPGGWAFDTSALDAHVRARGAFEPDHVVVLHVVRGGDATICDVPLESGVLIMLPDGHEITASIRGEVGYSAAVLPVDTWVDVLELATGQTDAAQLRIPRSVSQTPEHAAHAAAALASTQRCFDPINPLGQDMPAPFLDYLGLVAAAMAGTESLDGHLNRSLRHRLRQARLAGDFIHAKLQEPLSIMRVCREVGVSRRQLEYAFQTTFGVGPSEYVRLLRLNESRRQLKSARARARTVTDIAMDVGVTHLGRFAQSYRLLFGETPYQTLRGNKAG